MERSRKQADRMLVSRCYPAADHPYPRNEVIQQYIPRGTTDQSSMDSESSCPRLIDDRTGSEISLDDDWQYHAHATELWDSFWQLESGQNKKNESDRGSIKEALPPVGPPQQRRRPTEQDSGRRSSRWHTSDSPVQKLRNKQPAATYSPLSIPVALPPPGRTVVPSWQSSRPRDQPRRLSRPSGRLVAPCIQKLSHMTAVSISLTMPLDSAGGANARQPITIVDQRSPTAQLRDPRQMPPQQSMPQHPNHQQPRARPHHLHSSPYPGPGSYAAAIALGYPDSPPSPSLSYDPRSSPKNPRGPPVQPYCPRASMSSSQWHSLPSTPSYGPKSPTSPPFAPNAAGLRSRPTAPSGYEMGGISESYSKSPSRPPMAAKSSMPDLRSRDPAASFGNFSRPRKQSVRQPVSDIPVLPQPPLTLSGSGTETSDYAAYPWQRPRRLSLVSSVSPSTWAPGMSPTHGKFPGHRGPGGRMRNAGPPPTSATKPHFNYNKCTELSITGRRLSGAAPWLTGDEVRSSFRSHLIASSTPSTITTERSSVLANDMSTISLDAHAEGEVGADEPSLEDVPEMYEQDFDEGDQKHKRRPQEEDAYLSQHDAPSPSPNRHEKPINAHVEAHDDNSANVAMDLPMSSRLGSKFRQSNLIFTSPAFMASMSHLSIAMSLDELNDGEKRDFGKSLGSGIFEMSQSTVPPSREAMSSPHDSMATSSRQESPSPVPTNESYVKVRNELDFDPPRDPSYPESCPPPFIPGQVEPEEPGFRDRYGFEKETQYITRKQYDKWNAGYTDYLARRKKKWQVYLKKNSLMTENPNRFPSPSVKTKKFVRKGIPPEWRGAAWFYYAGGPAILAKHPGLYGKLLDKHAKRVDVEAIERDLYRTFPDNVKFEFPAAEAGVDGESPQQQREPPTIASLRRVLFAFSIYNPHIGYCQSLNFIAGLLLLFLETEEQCFWLLNVITHIYLPGTHEISLEGSKVDMGVLMAEIRNIMPAVWDKIGGELEGNSSGRPSVTKSLRRHKSRFRRKEPEELPTERLPPITLCMTAWFMSCFIGTLPIETTLRVWDVFFYEGSKALFRTALAIFKAGESEILAVTDPMEMFGVVQAMPRRMLDANSLIEACFKRRNSFNHLSQRAIAERRQERRDQLQSDKDGRSRSTPSGNLMENESGVRRKGTLFKRKKHGSSKLTIWR